MDTSFQVLMCLDGYGEVQTMDAEQKPMRFSKGETLFCLQDWADAWSLVMQN